VNEVALSANDDKRIIQPGKIQTLAHGYGTSWHEKPTRCGSPLPKKKTTTRLGQFRESTG